MTAGAGDEEPIEDYLDELLACLRLPPRETRRLLAEAEDHLRLTAEAGEHAGLTRVAAERQAVRAFGPATSLAADAAAAGRPTLRSIAAATLVALIELVGLGLTAVGISGLVAAGFNAVAGPGFVGALPQPYPPGLCLHYLALHPSAATCTWAAVLENSSDAVVLRLAAGVVGIALLLAGMSLARRSSWPLSARRLRNAAVGVAATIAFGVAAIGLIALAVDIAVQHGSGGVGFYLSGGIPSLLAAGGALAYTWRNLRTLRPWTHLSAA